MSLAFTVISVSGEENLVGAVESLDEVWSVLMGRSQGFQTYHPNLASLVIYRQQPSFDFRD